MIVRTRWSGVFWGILMVATAAEARGQPLTLSIVPVDGSVVEGGSVVSLEVFMTANRNIRMEGGQIDLPCTLPGGLFETISILNPGRQGGATSDPDGDGRLGPSSGGIPFMFGPSGIGVFQAATCTMTLVSATASPVEIAAGQTRYLGTYFYEVSACAKGDFLVTFEDITHPPVPSNRTRFREDVPPSPAAGMMLDLGAVGTTLSVSLGRCCGGATCLGEFSESCCLEEMSGITWDAGLTCQEACEPCVSPADCDDENVCTDDACELGSCVNRNNQLPCDDGLFCTAQDFCESGACAGQGNRCPGRHCDEETDSCVECLTDEHCDDDNSCTDETCVGGVCSYDDNTSNCNDGLFCTVGDRCSQGQCTGTLRTCPDGLACWEDRNACLERVLIVCESDAFDPVPGEVVEIHCSIVSADDLSIRSIGLDVPANVGSIFGPRLFIRGMAIDTLVQDPPYLFGPLGEFTFDPTAWITVQRPEAGIESVLLRAGELRYLATVLYVSSTCLGSELLFTLENQSSPPHTFDTTRIVDGQGGLVSFDVVSDPIMTVAGKCCDGNRCEDFTEFCCLVRGRGQSWTAGETCGGPGNACSPCHSPADCEDDSPCTNDMCIGGACVHSAAAGNPPCDDELFCNGSDACVFGGCIGAPDSAPCASVFCREDLDTCVECTNPQHCEDNNMCTNDVCTRAGECVHLANALPCDDRLFCTIDERCIDGFCRFGSESPCPDNVCNETQDRCLPDFCADSNFLQGNPPFGTVDGRQPHPPDDSSLSVRQGIGSPEVPIVLTLDVVGADRYCFELCETRGELGFPENAITSVIEGPDGVYTLQLRRPITIGAVTTISFGRDVFVHYVTHPGNTDGNNTATVVDIRRLITYLDGTAVPNHGLFSSDLDHSGAANPLDLMRLIELHLGSGQYEAWSNTPRPDNNTCP